MANSILLVFYRICMRHPGEYTIRVEGIQLEIFSQEQTAIEDAVEMSSRIFQFKKGAFRTTRSVQHNGNSRHVSMSYIRIGSLLF